MITKKDLQIINMALAQYEGLLEDCTHKETGVCSNQACEQHKARYGEPLRSLEFTRIRIHSEIAKRAEKE
jgi:hypothetical protein